MSEADYYLRDEEGNIINIEELRKSDISKEPFGTWSNWVWDWKTGEFIKDDGEESGT